MADQLNAFGNFLSQTALPRAAQGAGLGLDFIETLRSLEQPGGFMALQAQKAQALQDPTQRAAISQSPFLAGTYGLGLDRNLPTGAPEETARAGGALPGVQILGPGQAPQPATYPNQPASALVPQLPALTPGQQMEQTLAGAENVLVQQNPEAVARRQLGLPLVAGDYHTLANELVKFQQQYPTLRARADPTTGRLIPSTAPVASAEYFTEADAQSAGKRVGKVPVPTARGTWKIEHPSQDNSFDPAEALRKVNEGLAKMGLGPVSSAATADVGLTPDTAPSPAPQGAQGAPPEAPPQPQFTAPPGMTPFPGVQTAAPSPAPQPAQAGGKIGYPSGAFDDQGRAIVSPESQAAADKLEAQQNAQAAQRGFVSPPSQLEVTQLDRPPTAVQGPLGGGMEIKKLHIPLGGKATVDVGPKKALPSTQVSELSNVAQIKAAIRDSLTLMQQGAPRAFLSIPKGGQTTGPLTARMIDLAMKLRDPLFSPGGKVPDDPLYQRQARLASDFRRVFDIAFIFAGKRLSQLEIKRMFEPLVPDMNLPEDVNRAKIMGIQDIINNIETVHQKYLRLDPGDPTENPDKDLKFDQSDRGQAIQRDIYSAQAQRFLLMQQNAPKALGPMRETP